MLAAINLSLLKDKRLVYGIVAVLAVAVLFSLIKRGATIYRQRHWQAPNVVTTGSAKIGTLPDIAHLHLFDINLDVKPVAAIPKTDLHYKLVGVLTLGQFTPAQAIIEIPGQGTLIYTQGQRLPGNAIITQISPTQVILNRNNRLEVLPLQMYSEEGKS